MGTPSEVTVRTSWLLSLGRVKPGATGWRARAGRVLDGQVRGAEKRAHAVDCRSRMGAADVAAVGSWSAGQPCPLRPSVRGPQSSRTHPIFVPPRRPCAHSSRRTPRRVGWATISPAVVDPPGDAAAPPEAGCATNRPIPTEPRCHGRPVRITQAEPRVLASSRHGRCEGRRPDRARGFVPGTCHEGGASTYERGRTPILPLGTASPSHHSPERRIREHSRSTP